MLMSRTPVRIEIGGGGTDVEPYSSDFGGFVLNVTINKYFRTILTKTNDEFINIFSNDAFSAYKFEVIKKYDDKLQTDDLITAIIYYLKPQIGMDIYIHGEPPKKAGLGASASLSTSLIAGIYNVENKPIKLENIAEDAFFVEKNILKNAGGRQDQYASVYGGLNCMEFLGDNNVKVGPLKISNSFSKEIENDLILFYSGTSHTSGDMVQAQINSYVEQKRNAKERLDKLKEIAYEMKDSLISEDLEKFGKLLSEDLQVKSDFNPMLMTNYMKELNKFILDNGAIGGRVCGAGGGGCMIWLVPPKIKDHILTKLKSKQGKLLEYMFAEKGLEITMI